MPYRIVLPALALLALPSSPALGAPSLAAPAAALVQDDAGQDAKKTPKRTAKRGDDARGVGDERGQKRAGDDAGDGDGAKPEKKPITVTAEELRAAFAREYFARKDGAAAELDAAREEFAGDATAFAAKRTEIARKYRGELVSLQKSYVDKAKASGLDLGLPTDPRQLEAVAAQAAPEAALRSRFAEEVARLTEAAQLELDQARSTVGGDRAAFAAKRTEIARKYRGQALALQQQFAQRASGMGATLDTSGAAKVLAAFAPAPGQPPAGDESKDDAAKPADASQADAGQGAAKKDDAGPPKGAAGQGKPLDAQTLRAAFTKQVETIRTEAAGELSAADGSLEGDALTAKRVEIARRYRSQLGRIRQLFADRAAAAGVTMPLPTDEDLAPELVAAAGAGSPPAPPQPTPKPAPGDEADKKGGDPQNGEGQKNGEDDKKGEDESTPEKKGDEEKKDEKKTPPSEKPGKGPRWGRKNG